MTSILALTLSAALAQPVAATERSREALLTQASNIAAAPVLTAGEIAARSRFAPPGGDSLKNGAAIGAVVIGAGLGAFVYYLCNALDETGEEKCFAGSAVWAGIGAAGGALIGAGIDALFDQRMGALPRSSGRLQPARPLSGASIRFRLRF